jgi:hypothetical protein
MKLKYVCFVNEEPTVKQAALAAADLSSSVPMATGRMLPSVAPGNKNQIGISYRESDEKLFVPAGPDESLFPAGN